MSKMLQKSGKFTLTNHAKDRIRQRAGIESAETAVSWVNEEIAKATNVFSDKHDSKLTHYLTDSFEMLCDGLKVVTVKNLEIKMDYTTKLGAAVAKEATKLLTVHRRALRKAEINVVQLTLNFLKAKNPKIKSGIQSKLTKAADEKAKLEYEVKAIEIAARKYGVEV